MAGQYFDAETGLHYNYHRYYDPATGRYLTPDPIGLAGGINLFAYTENNPLNGIDPYGLFDIALTPYAIAAAPAIAMADSPFLPFGDAAAGALIGIAMLHDKIEGNTPIPAQLAEGSEDGDNSCPSSGYEPTPSTDPDDFDPWRKAKKNKKTGEIWERDPSRHGGEHYEVYKNKKMYEKGVRDRAVWSDGGLKEKW